MSWSSWWTRVRDLILLNFVVDKGVWFCRSVSLASCLAAAGGALHACMHLQRVQGLIARRCSATARCDTSQRRCTAFAKAPCMIDPLDAPPSETLREHAGWCTGWLKLGMPAAAHGWRADGILHVQ